MPSAQTNENMETDKSIYMKITKVILRNLLALVLLHFVPAPPPSPLKGSASANTTANNSSCDGLKCAFL